MSHELREGVELLTVFWSEGEALTAGRGQCESIVVREQTGQMAMVPWVEVTLIDGTSSLYNLALVEGVTVLDRQSK